MTNQLTKTTEEWQADYRSQLLNLEQKAQDSYDKTVLTLSTGAFAITFAFVTDFVDMQAIILPILLIGAWCAWSISAAAILLSHYFSVLALRHAVKQLDKQTIYTQTPGGGFNISTMLLNFAAGALFIVGLALIIGFVQLNFVR